MKNLILIISIIFLELGYANAQVNVCITQPQNNSQVVQPNNIIRGTVGNGLLPGQCIIVFVQDPNKNWWPYFNVNQIRGTKTWEVNGVQYGMPIDKGKPFSIRAVIMSSTVQTDGLNISTNQDGSISLNNFAAFIKGLNSNSYSAIVSVIRE